MRWAGHVTHMGNDSPPPGCPKSKVYETVILPGMTNGCQTWSVTLTKNLRLRMCENRMPRMLGYERERRLC